ALRAGPGEQPRRPHVVGRPSLRCSIGYRGTRRRPHGRRRPRPRTRTGGGTVSRRMMIDLHPRRENARRAAELVCTALVENGIVPVMSRSAHDMLSAYGDVRPNGAEIVDDAALSAAAADCELIMVLGGDGTILRAAERFHSFGVPVM